MPLTQTEWMQLQVGINAMRSLNISGDRVIGRENVLSLLAAFVEGAYLKEVSAEAITVVVPADKRPPASPIAESCHIDEGQAVYLDPDGKIRPVDDRPPATPVPGPGRRLEP